MRQVWLSHQLQIADLCQKIDAFPLRGFLVHYLGRTTPPLQQRSTQHVCKFNREPKWLKTGKTTMHPRHSNHHFASELTIPPKASPSK